MVRSSSPPASSVRLSAAGDDAAALVSAHGQPRRPQSTPCVSAFESADTGQRSVDPLLQFLQRRGEHLAVNGAQRFKRYPREIDQAGLDGGQTAP